MSTSLTPFVFLRFASFVMNFENSFPTLFRNLFSNMKAITLTGRPPNFSKTSIAHNFKSFSVSHSQTYTSLYNFFKFWVMFWRHVFFILIFCWIHSLHKVYVTSNRLLTSLSVKEPLGGRFSSHMNRCILWFFQKKKI